MQLSLFEYTPEQPEAVGDYEDIAPLLSGMLFGPVNAVEAANNTTFISAPAYQHAISHDVFQSLQQSGRLAKIVEEATIDKLVNDSGIDGRHSVMKDEWIPIVLDKMNGMTYAQLGAKYRKHPNSVYAFMNRPSTRMFVAKLLGEYAATLGDVRERILHHATEAVEVVVDIMRNGKEENKQKSAFALLRMGGFDDTRSVTVNQNNVNVENPLAADAGRLADVLTESLRVRSAGASQYVDQQRSYRAADEVGVVEAPAGLKKLASA